MLEFLTGVAFALPWSLVAIGIVRGLQLIARGARLRWQGGIRACLADRNVRTGATLLSAAGSCGGFLAVAMGWPA